MVNESRPPNRQTSGVKIGDVWGGIVHSIIAGRDVVLKFIEINIPGGQDVERAQRNRQAMLQLVRNTWIKGVLEQSLQGAALINLGLEERTEAVEHPWDMVVQSPDRPNHTLPPGTKIIDVFDEMNGTLLILGEPGSGKTTMLLELARDSIARAEQDPTQPIPVVFNLSSWNAKRQPLAEWLVEELAIRYNIPKRIARPWVENDDLLLLLDGLDEVKLEHQEACVKAINDLRQKHLMHLAICSRLSDYEALTTRLNLQGAILLQPLTFEKVKAHLSSMGSELAAVYETLRDDVTLQELVRSPLMLGIITLVYRDASGLELHMRDTLEARRRHLFDTYVQKMFLRRGMHKLYSPDQTIQILAWLAARMSDHGYSTFFVEQMQPDWLPLRSQQVLYGLGIRLVIGMVIGLASALLYIVDDNLELALVIGLGAGLSAVLASLMTIKVPTLVAIGLGAGSLALLADRYSNGPGGLVAAVVFGLPAGLAGVSLKRINIAEKLRWSWARAFAMLAVLAGIYGALSIGARGMFAFIDVGTLLPIGLAFVLGLAWKHSEIEMTAPNQRLRQSAQNAFRGGLLLVSASILCGLLLGVVLNMEKEYPPGDWSGLSKGLSFGLLIAPMVALPVWLYIGGSAWLQHLALRFMLAVQGHVPWRLVRFLNYATDRILLRRVGGGYIFVHRLLLDHLAQRHKSPKGG